MWKAITLALKSQGLPVTHWQSVLREALHSVRSLLSTATNTTPHERFFAFSRRSPNGTTLPKWLCSPGPVLLRKFVRHSKTDPLVEEVDLIHANPEYAHVRYHDGKETTVSLRHLAPPAEPNTENSHYEESHGNEEETDETHQDNINDQEVPLRRSGRIRREPDRLTYE